MKKFTLFLFCLLLVACGAAEPRKGSISVDYEGSNVFRSGGLYSDRETIKLALESDSRPLRLLFSSPSCPSCKKVENFIKNRELQNQVIIANAEDKFVQEILTQIGGKQVVLPFMMVMEKDQKNSRVAFGPTNIALELLRNTSL
tara:strand:- start:101 stop:532 length:432 start_codon:yes stop_codon:yes gene_type:complete